MFVEQWKQFVESGCNELESSLKSRLDAIYLNADSVCDTLDQETKRAHGVQSELKSLLTTMESDISSLQSDTSAASKLFKEEDTKLRKSILELKKSTIENTKKSIASNSVKATAENRSGSHKNDKLLKELQSI